MITTNAARRRAKRAAAKGTHRQFPPIHHHNLRALQAKRGDGVPSVLIGFACTQEGCDELFTPKGNPSSWDRPQRRDDWKNLPNHSHALRVAAR